MDTSKITSTPIEFSSISPDLLELYPGLSPFLPELESLYADLSLRHQEAVKLGSEYKASRGTMNVPSHHPEYDRRMCVHSLARTKFELALRALFCALRKLDVHLRLREGVGQLSPDKVLRQLFSSNVLKQEKGVSYDDERLREFIVKFNVRKALELSDEAAEFYFSARNEHTGLAAFIDADHIDRIAELQEREYVVVKRQYISDVESGTRYKIIFLEGKPDELPAGPYMTRVEAENLANHLDKHNPAMNAICMIGPPKYCHVPFNVRTKE